MPDGPMMPPALAQSVAPSCRYACCRPPDTSRLRAAHLHTQDFVRPKGRQCFPTGQLPPHWGNTPPLHVSNVVVVIRGRVVVVVVAAATVVVVVGPPVVVVVEAVGAVVVTQGLPGPQLPGPALVPFWALH